MQNKLVRLFGGKFVTFDKPEISELIIDGEFIKMGRDSCLENKPKILDVDCSEFIVSPGFIEIQFNGCCGYDFSDQLLSLKDSIDFSSKWLLEQGVTGFCPTFVSSKSEFYKNVFNSFSSSQLNTDGAKFLGFHVEGPFINPTKGGAHDIESLIYFDRISPSIVDQVLGNNLDLVKILTLAPEIPGSLDVIKYLTEKKIKVSIGHTNASYDIMVEALNAGATKLTHIFNASRSFHHRDPASIALLVKNEESYIPPYFGVICDGIHLDRKTVNVVHHLNSEKLILTTDSTPANGLKDGENYHIGKTLVTIRNQISYIGLSNNLAGSMARMNECVKNLSRFSFIPIESAIKSATIIPAKFLDIDDFYGSLEKNKKASIIIMDHECKIHATFVDGSLKYLFDKSQLYSSLSHLLKMNNTILK